MIVYGFSYIRTECLLGGTKGTTAATLGPVTQLGLSAYWDQHCLNETTCIEWGPIALGTAKNITMFLKNVGNTEISLSVKGRNWVPPETSGYLSLSWNYTGEILYPEEVIEVVFNLAVSEYMIDKYFSFDMVFVLNMRPVATLSVDKSIVNTDENVTFNASNSTDDGRIDYYFFDFGDGANSGWTTLPLAIHMYTSEGIYNTTVSVMDDYGVTSKNSELIEVQITVVPEFPSIIILLLVLIFTTFAVTIRRKRLP